MVTLSQISVGADRGVLVAHHGSFYLGVRLLGFVLLVHMACGAGDITWLWHAAVA